MVKQILEVRRDSERLVAERQRSARIMETFDEDLAKRVFQKFRDNETWQCPTLVVLRGESLADRPEFNLSYLNIRGLKYTPSSTVANWRIELDGKTAEDYKLDREWLSSSQGDLALSWRDGPSGEFRGSAGKIGRLFSVSHGWPVLEPFEMAERTDPTSDLLFGLLAVESGLIGRDALFAAVQAWEIKKERSLGQLLVEQGAMNEAQRAFVEVQVAMRSNHPASDHEKTMGSPVEERRSLDPTAPVRDIALMTTMGSSGPVSDTVGERVEPLQAGTEMDVSTGDASGTEADTSGETGRGRDDFALNSHNSNSDVRRFRVLNPHASGGLGVIFVALDAELNREVALKQIKDRYAGDPVSRSRFLLEAEITGGLEHPGIVPVYGLGTDADGRLYYAMRFIRGDSLADAIAKFRADATLELDPGARSLELRKLLRRFLDVCNTMEYAHGRGVLHRDLKPDNIMVGRYGETLVVDWGIAKVTGRADPRRAAGERPLVAASGAGATETLAGTTIGSPSYMSPEQAAGDIENLGVASDVYSLGATLYCMITGRAPVEGADLKSVLLAVRSGIFPAPREIDRSIDPALEAICLKAMAVKPSDRYPSARALAEDVERWMADEPVSARADPMTERLRRWMRRRKTAVTAGAAAMLVATGGLAVVLAVEARANRELRDANDQVQARFALAQRAIRTFHSGVSEDLLLGQREFKELQDKLLRSALDFYTELEGLLESRSDRPSREALARAYYEVGEVTSKIGSKTDALVAHRQALALREALASEKEATAESIADVGRSKLAIGLLEKVTGDVTKAETDLASGRDLLEGLGAKDQGTPEILADLALGYERIGNLLDETGRTDNAITAHERARDIRLALVKSWPSVAAYRASLARSHQFLGALLNKRGMTKEALASCEEARSLRQALTTSDPAGKDYQADLAATESLLGTILDNLEQNNAALEAHNRARDIREALALANPTVAQFQDDLARSHFYSARLFSKTGKPDDAVASFRRARDIWQNLTLANPAVPHFRSDLLAVLVSLGSELARAGRTDDALKEFERSRTIYEELIRKQPKLFLYQSNLALIHVRIGIVQADTGRTADALTSFRTAADYQKKLVQAEPNVPRYESDLAWTYHAIGEQLARIGRPIQTIESFEKARDILRRQFRAYSNVTSYRAGLERTQTHLGLLRFEGGYTSDALALCEEARATFATLSGANSAVTSFKSDLSSTLEMLGAILSEAGRDHEARVAYEQARGLRRLLLQSNPNSAIDRAELARNEAALATLLVRKRESVRALVMHEQVRVMREELVRANPAMVDRLADLAESDDQIAALLARDGRHAEALTASERAQRTWSALTTSYPSIYRFRVGQVRSLRGLGDLLERSGERDDAAKAYSSSRERASSSSDEFPELSVFQVEMALSDESLGDLKLEDGRAEEAVVLLRRAAGILAAQTHLRPGDLLALARVHARLASIVAAGITHVDPQNEAVLAMTCLHKAVRAGFHSPDILGNDAGFGSLRSRADFQLLVMDLAFPTDPFQE